MGRLTDDDTEAALRLLVAIAMFADNLATMPRAQQRRHQAVAARDAADRLRTLATRNLTANPVKPIARKLRVRARQR